MGVRGEEAAAVVTLGHATVLPARGGCEGTWPPAQRAAPVLPWLAASTHGIRLPRRCLWARLR